MVHAGPGQPDRAPQSVVFPKLLLFTITSTPLPPLLHVSAPVRSVAPMIFPVIVVPT
jgi:hypothetical protein